MHEQSSQTIPVEDVIFSKKKKKKRSVSTGTYSISPVTLMAVARQHCH